MPVDLVTIGFGADTSDLAQANTALDSVTAAAGRTQKAVDGLADEFVDAGQKVQQSVGAATAAAERDLKRSAVQFRSLQEQINQGLRIGQGGGSASASAKAIQELTTLREKYVPLAKAQRDYGDAQAEIADAAKRGAISETERVAALNAAAVAFQKQTGFVKEAGGAAKLTAAQMQQLGFQVNDLATQIASGASPFQAMAQQGGQIYQALSMGPGGAGGSVRALGEVIGRLATSAPAVFTAIAAAVVGVGLAINKITDDQRNLERALSTGLGRGAGVSPDTFKQITDAASTAAQVSKSTAQEIGMAFAQTGKIGGAMFGDLTVLASRFGLTVGEDAVDAAKELAKAFASPLKGMEQIESRIGALDATTREYVRNAMMVGDVFGAQQALARGLDAALVKLPGRIETLGDAWIAFKNKVSNLASAAVGIKTLSERIKGAQEEYEGLLRSQGAFFGATDKTVQASADRLMKLYDDLFKAEEKTRLEREKTQKNNSDKAIADAMRGHELEMQAIAAKTEVERAAIAGQQAYNQAIEAGLSVQAAKVMQINAEEKALASLRAGIDQTIKSYRDQADASNKGADILNAGGGTAAATAAMEKANALGRVAAEISAAQARADQASGEEKAKLTQQVDGLRQKYNELANAIDAAHAAQDRMTAAAMNNNIQQRLDMVNLEIQMIGKSTEARYKAIEALKTEQAIQNQFINPNSAAADSVRMLSRQLVDQQLKLDRAKKSVDDYAGSLSKIATAAVGAGSALQTMFAAQFSGGGGAQTGTYSIYSTNYANEVANYNAWQKQAQAENTAAQSELQRTISMLERNIQSMQGRWDNYRPSPYAEKNPLVFYDVNTGSRFTEAERTQIKKMEEQLAAEQKQLAELQRIAQLLQMPAGQALRDPLTFNNGGRNLGPSIYDNYINGYGALVNKDLLGIYPGFAEGGSMMIGGKSGRDNNVLSLNGSPIAKVSKGERLDVLTPRQQTQGASAAAARAVSNDNRQFHISIKREGPPPSSHRQWEDERMADERLARRIGETARRLAK